MAPNAGRVPLDHRVAVCLVLVGHMELEASVDIREHVGTRSWPVKHRCVCILLPDLLDPPQIVIVLAST
jgi:hypothetical protein